MKKIYSICIVFFSIFIFSSFSFGEITVPLDSNFIIQQGYINNYVLTPSTNKEVAIPTGSNYVSINSTKNIWVKIGGAATIPSGDVTDGTGSELNPKMRSLGSNTIIGVISSGAAKISVIFYK